jgi:UDP-N-acetylglucosamine 2-epimerase
MAKVVTVVGARPQFIKAAPVSRALLAARHSEILVHTGQHYDANMSAIFFDELGLAPPAHNLGIGSGTHGAQTGAMLEGIEQVLADERPDWVLIYGDTNSTLAGALAAAKLHVRVAHVEAGLRSFNRRMPEEINRVVADHLSDLLLVPSQTAVDNLSAEGIARGVHIVGDVMADALALAAERSRDRPDMLAQLGIADRGYLLATIHRAENTDSLPRLKSILAALDGLNEPVVFPVHPRTRKILETIHPKYAAGTSLRRSGTGDGNLKLIEPVGYLDMVGLERSARMILTDSGGIQKEAYWLRVPCVTLRDETEWVETVQAGWNIIAAADSARIVQAVRAFKPPAEHPPLYGDGHAAERIAALL